VITHPEKVLFPDDGITKSEVAAYYEAVAPVMLRTFVNGRSRWNGTPQALARRAFFTKMFRRGFRRG
jgi:bifunctional non-homologous end joining protein LigD